jgi:hypothetical protein
MKQHDIRFIDLDNPNTPSNLVAEIKKSMYDAGDKYESYTVNHEPINLKAKLALKIRVPASAASETNEDDTEIIDEDYTDEDDDSLDL